MKQNTNRGYYFLIILIVAMVIMPCKVVSIYGEYINSQVDIDYYEVRTAEDLNQIRTSPSAIYIIMNDIDLTENSAWIPIEKFSGVLDGKGHIIKGLNIDISYKLSGLIGENTGTIENIVLEKPTVLFDGKALDSTVGFIAGVNKGVIKDIYIKNGYMGNIPLGGKGNNIVGGVVGDNISQVEYCYVNIQARGCNLGGVVGKNSKTGTIKYCASDGNLEASYSCGGLAASNYGKINNCFSTISFEIPSGDLGIYVAGIVGDNIREINYCYATNNISGWSNKVYGIGWQDPKQIKSRQSFYNKDLVEVTTNTHLINIEGRSTEELKQKSTYVEQGWDFEDIWEIDDGNDYPILKWLKTNYSEELERPEELEKPKEPEESGKLEEPKEPGELEEPEEPEELEEPEKPEESEKPEEPKEPEEPEELEEPEMPTKPETLGGSSKKYKSSKNEFGCKEPIIKEDVDKSKAGIILSIWEKIIKVKKNKFIGKITKYYRLKYYINRPH